MIYDILSNAEQYAALNADIANVLEAAKVYTPENYPGGKIQLDGDRVYMNLANYDTRSPENASMEAHRRYIDVMIMVEGSETIYVKDVNRLKNITKPYDASIDALLADLDADTTAIRMEPGNFVVLFPQDAHAPSCHGSAPCQVKKIIGKVRVL